MGFWKKEKVFPIIGEVITKLHHTHGRLIHQREISESLLKAAKGAKLVGQVHKIRANKTSPEFEAMAMVAQFSKLLGTRKMLDQVTTTATAQKTFCSHT
jgi:hypothetical protein